MTVWSRARSGSIHCHVRLSVGAPCSMIRTGPLPARWYAIRNPSTSTWCMRGIVPQVFACRPSSRSWSATDLCHSARRPAAHRRGKRSDTASETTTWLFSCGFARVPGQTSRAARRWSRRTPRAPSPPARRRRRPGRRRAGRTGPRDGSFSGTLRSVHVPSRCVFAPLRACFAPQRDGQGGVPLSTGPTSAHPGTLSIISASVQSNQVDGDP